MHNTSDTRKKSHSLFPTTVPLTGIKCDSRVAANYALLRWVAVLGQLITVVVVNFWLQIEIPLQPILGTIAMTGITNLVFHLVTTMSGKAESNHNWPWEQIIFWMMVFDLVVLTTLLYYTGGLFNPFSVFFLVNVCLAGVTLSARATGMLLNFAVGSCIFLVFYHQTLPELVQPMEIISESGEKTIYLKSHLKLYGMLIALVTCALVIGYFTTLVHTVLRQRNEELNSAELDRAKGEKLEALGTLAAGAAHELSTPLGTIAIISTELVREMETLTVPDTFKDDIMMIRTEVARCRKILDRMAAKAGMQTVESDTKFTTRIISTEIMSDLSERNRINWIHEEGLEDFEVRGPMILLSQALRGLIHNGLEASPVECRVECRWSKIIMQDGSNGLQLVITDQGEGMSEETLSRIGEPFFTTKPPGRGMGLGLFLCRSVVERLGGTLTYKSELNVGTNVIVQIPTPHDLKFLGITAV